jgi:hypothetical protein
MRLSDQGARTLAISGSSDLREAIIPAHEDPRFDRDRHLQRLTRMAARARKLLPAQHPAKTIRESGGAL